MRYSNPNAKDRRSHPNGCRAPRPIFDSVFLAGTPTRGG